MIPGDGIDLGARAEETAGAEGRVVVAAVEQRRERPPEQVVTLDADALPGDPQASRRGGLHPQRHCARAQVPRRGLGHGVAGERRGDGLGAEDQARRLAGEGRGLRDEGVAAQEARGGPEVVVGPRRRARTGRVRRVARRVAPLGARAAAQEQVAVGRLRHPLPESGVKAPLQGAVRPQEPEPGSGAHPAREGDAAAGAGDEPAARRGVLARPRQLPPPPKGPVFADPKHVERGRGHGEDGLDGRAGEQHLVAAVARELLDREAMVRGEGERGPAQVEILVEAGEHAGSGLAARARPGQARHHDAAAREGRDALEAVLAVAREAAFAQQARAPVELSDPALTLRLADQQHGPRAGEAASPQDEPVAGPAPRGAHAAVGLEQHRGGPLGVQEHERDAPVRARARVEERGAGLRLQGPGVHDEAVPGQPQEPGLAAREHSGEQGLVAGQGVNAAGEVLLARGELEGPVLAGPGANRRCQQRENEQGTEEGGCPDHGVRSRGGHRPHRQASPPRRPVKPGRSALRPARSGGSRARRGRGSAARAAGPCASSRRSGSRRGRARGCCSGGRWA